MFSISTLIKKNEVGLFLKPSFYLMLLFTASSCTVKRLVKIPINNNDKIMSGYWTVKAIIIPNDSDFPVPLYEVSQIVTPDQIISLFNAGQPKIFLLSYKLKNASEVVMIKNHLYSLGFVKQIDVISPNN